MKSNKQIVLVVTIFIFHHSFGFDKLPPYIKRCSRSDPKFNECCIKNGHAAIPVICEGDPRYLIPNLKPFKLDYASLESTNTIKLYAHNVEVSGFGRTQIKEFNWDFDNKVIDVKVIVPEMITTGIYNMHGRILIVNLKGTGPLNNTYYGNEITGKLEYSLIPKHNKEYFHIDKADIHLNITKGVHLFFGNLLNNTVLSEQMNAFLNENWKIMLDDLYPSINEIMETILIAVINPITAKIPFVDLFTP